MHITETTAALLLFGFGGCTSLMSPRHAPGNGVNPCKAAANFLHWDTNLWAKTKMKSAQRTRVEENRKTTGKFTPKKRSPNFPRAHATSRQ